MNKGFYLKMAWGNIRKNRNIYLPYLLAASVMTALFYIQGSLCDMVDISGMKGKRMMSSLLGISTPITGIFSLVILFYVNSFVMKQRKKEFGLYNVLGMEKRHLVILMSVEILLVAVFSLVFGISGGALFSQLFFLIFYKMIRMEADLTMVIPRGAVIETLTLFGILFCLVLLYDIVAVIRTRPVELLKSESQGEREPKVHGLAALIGVAALTGVFVGYRGYDRSGTEPFYPFGYGLSYTTFAYSNMAAEKTGKHQVTVSFDIENTGKMDASEVAQVYVHDVQSSVPRPLKELKGYEKVFLKKGEKKRVSVVLDEDAFSFYDMNQHRFVVEKGDFEILVGAKSAPCRCGAHRRSAQRVDSARKSRARGASER